MSQNHISACQPPASPPITSRFAPNSAHGFHAFLDQNGKPYVVMLDKGNPYAVAVGSGALNSTIRQGAREQGVRLSQKATDDISKELAQDAADAGHLHDTWYRVAPIDGGVEIDRGDESHSRVRITNGTVETITDGSNVLFRRSPHSRPMVAPAEQGNLKLLKPYANLDDASFLLFTAWLSYTLAHPKVPASKYVILQILGGQGCGKSMLTKLVKNLIDPAITDAQVLPTKANELCIASQQAHVLCYDNLRHLPQYMSDLLCITATRGSVSSRQLYSNDEQHVMTLHAALVLNGIHSFVSQSDLAQRCLPFYLKPIPASGRRSESQMERELENDMPAIQRGLFDLIAKVQMQLPNVELTSSERMIDFSRWLAAMEIVNGVGAGTYQSLYSFIMVQGQREALLDNVFAATILEFGDGLDEDGWTGTPTLLLNHLNIFAEISTQRSRDWPDNPSALSKRLQSQQAALLTQGIRVDFGRSKERTITIKKEVSK